MTRDERDKKLLAFADAHGVELTREGEVGLVGFGRPAVGFSKDGQYVAYHPMNMKTYDVVEGFDGDDDRFFAPDGVDAYHKANCLCVLASGPPEEPDIYDYEAALDGLCTWVEHLESQGDVEVVKYATGATGVQEMVSGVDGYGIRFKAPAEV